MIFIQKIYGFHGINRQNIEKSWYVTPVTDKRTNERRRRKVENRAVFCSTRNRNNGKIQFRVWGLRYGQKYGLQLTFILMMSFYIIPLSSFSRSFLWCPSCLQSISWKCEQRKKPVSSVGNFHPTVRRLDSLKQVFPGSDSELPCTMPMTLFLLWNW